MEELLKNGPLVSSFEPTYEFMSYSSGIYHSVDANSWIKNGEKKPGLFLMLHIMFLRLGEDRSFSFACWVKYCLF